ncbi:MAG: hypothetical protein QOH35_1106, partial [Acidobacteriaceae bacterium]|nr:hypothetical protein [Acidobacteriaceae bacterium]
MTVAVLQPLPALGQACDPNTSYCGGSAASGQQGQQGQQLQLPSLQSGNVPGTTPTQQNQNPYGTGGGGGYTGAGGNFNNGAPQSMDLQSVPSFVDNLNGLPGRSESSNARSYPLYYQRFFAPDQPTEFQRRVYASVGQMLPIYGAKLFLQSP